MKNENQSQKQRLAARPSCGGQARRAGVNPPLQKTKAKNKAARHGNRQRREAEAGEVPGRWIGTEKKVNSRQRTANRSQRQRMAARPSCGGQARRAGVNPPLQKTKAKGKAGGGVAVRRGDERVEILRRSCSDRLRMTVFRLVVSYRELKPTRSRRKSKAGGGAAAVQRGPLRRASKFMDGVPPLPLRCGCIDCTGAKRDKVTRGTLQSKNARDELLQW